MKEAWVLSYPLSAQQRLWSDWADDQADLSLRWSHTHFVGFIMSRLKYKTIFQICDNFGMFHISYSIISFVKQTSLSQCKKLNRTLTFFLSLIRSAGYWDNGPWALTCDTSLIFRELPEMSHKTSRIYHFYQNFEISLIWMKSFLTYFIPFLINLTEMKTKSLGCPFETYHMYVCHEICMKLLS